MQEDMCIENRINYSLKGCLLRCLMLHYTFLATICWLSHVLVKWHTCRNTTPVENQDEAWFATIMLIYFSVKWIMTGYSIFFHSCESQGHWPAKLHYCVCYGMGNTYLWNKNPLIHILWFNCLSLVQAAQSKNTLGHQNMPAIHSCGYLQGGHPGFGVPPLLNWSVALVTVSVFIGKYCVSSLFSSSV